MGQELLVLPLICTLAVHSIEIVTGCWQTYGEGRVNHTCSFNLSFIPGCSFTGDVHSNRIGLGNLNLISRCLYNFCCNLGVHWWIYLFNVPCKRKTA